MDQILDNKGLPITKKPYHIEVVEAREGAGVVKQKYEKKTDKGREKKENKRPGKIPV